MYSLLLLGVSLSSVFSFPSQQQNYDHIPQCAQPPASGLCLAYFPSFYYNPSTETCEEFVFGGCQGNLNRFVTREACMETCGGFKIEKKEFKLRTESDELQEHSKEKLSEASSEEESSENVANSAEADSSANDSAAQTLAAEKQPGEQHPAVEQQPGEQPAVEQQPPVNPCTLPSNIGPCRGFFPRFYFNGDRCETFLYGGCQGNQNNFQTVEECRQICGSSSSEDNSSSSSEEVAAAKSESTA